MDFEAILTEAHRAASDAQAGMQEGRSLDCGFAWVTISGNDALARYCRTEYRKTEDALDAGGNRQNIMRRQRDLGRKGYPTGWQWWKPGGYPGQSIGIHEAGAHAFRDVLAKHGIRADVGSRYD